MRIANILMLTAAGSIFLGMKICSAQPAGIDVEQIIRKANHVALYQGSDCKGKLALNIVDKQGRQRQREFNILRKDAGDSDKDQKYFTYFEAPADVRKMVFMVHKHAGLGKDDDRWLYMPALDLVKRIAASDKRTSFVGSAFLYEDISGRGIEEDTHEFIRTTGEYYVIKNTPKRPEEAEFEYYVVYIDKNNFIPMKMEYFKKEDRLYRTIAVEEVAEIPAVENGKMVIYPTVVSSVAGDLENGSKTRMVFSNIQYNTGLTDEIFTERYLRKAPREVMR